MSTKDARDLGKSLAMSKREEQRLAENITPDDPGEQVVLGVSERFRIVRNHIRIVKNVADDLALAFDRPDLGQMFDNVNKSFDVKYDNAKTEVLFEEEL